MEVIVEEKKMPGESAPRGASAALATSTASLIYGGALPHKTRSLCPECKRILPALVFEEDRKVFIERSCPQHGIIREVYSEDVEFYEKVRKFSVGEKRIQNPNVGTIVENKGVNCPMDCGLCASHKSTTALANIAVTNRCDLSCWYCFFYAKEGEPIYEPTIEQIRAMLANLRAEKPVACNAIQLSLDYGERILLKSPEGLIVSREIGEFVDSLMTKSNPKHFNKPIPHEVSEAGGWYVLSIDEKLNTVFKPISAVIRHANECDLFEIETDYGWKIRTTGSHSVFVLDENANILPKPVSELRKNEVLLGSLIAPSNGNVLKEVDLFSLVVENARTNPILLEKIKVLEFSESDELTVSNPIILRDYLKNKTQEGSLKYLNSRNEKLPFKIPVTPELCRLLGYYVGEGCVYRNGVIFSFGSRKKETIEDFLYCIKQVLGVDVQRTTIGSTIKFYIKGYLYKLFFELLGCGKKAVEKKIPWLIFNVSPELKKQFLKTYFECNGNTKIKKTGFEIYHNIVSKKLAADLVLIHTQLGITTKIEESVSKPHFIKQTKQRLSKSSLKYRLVIGEKIELEKSLWYLDGEERKKFEEYIFSGGRHTPSFSRLPLIEPIRQLANFKTSEPQINLFLKSIRHNKSISKQYLAEITNQFKREGIGFTPILNDFSHGSLGVFKIRRIKRVKPTSKFVYDLSVSDSQAFFAGLGALLAHNTGGEPTLREDLPEIVRACRELGFEHIQLNTTGIKIGFDASYAKKLREAGVNTLYMSFDGTTPQTNPKNHWEAPYTLESCRQAGMGIVLVPTLIRSVNLGDVGNIINFALNNIDIVRAVNFQPVSLVGRMPVRERERQRVTIPGAIAAIEEQTNGVIAKSDFFPIPCVFPITKFIEAWTGVPQYELSTHFACGAATYLFLDNDKVIPITRFIDVEGLFGFLNEKAEEISRGANKYWVGLKIFSKLNTFIDHKKAPKSLNVTKLLFNALVKHDYNALGEFHKKSLFIGMMHFMDLYNYDIERVRKCVIHYSMPDGRIVPFCAFNVIPEIYRDKVQREYSIPWSEWLKTHKNPNEEKYARDGARLAQGEAYKKAYSQQKQFFEKHEKQGAKA